MLTQRLCTSSLLGYLVVQSVSDPATTLQDARDIPYTIHASQGKCSSARLYLQALALRVLHLFYHPRLLDPAHEALPWPAPVYRGVAAISCLFFVAVFGLWASSTEGPMPSD